MTYELTVHHDPWTPLLVGGLGQDEDKLTRTHTHTQTHTHIMQVYLMSLWCTMTLGGHCWWEAWVKMRTSLHTHTHTHIMQVSLMSLWCTMTVGGHCWWEAWVKMRTSLHARAHARAHTHTLTHTHTHHAGVSYELVVHHDPRRPLLVGGLGQDEDKLGVTKLRFKRHRQVHVHLLGQDRGFHIT